MKQELMTFSNDEELQKKWKSIVSVTLSFELLSEKFENLSEIIKGTLDKYCKEEPKREVNKSYSHIYSPSVDKFKMNTKGYPNKILLCARSRCLNGILPVLCYNLSSKYVRK